jgi:hypothetical protein
MITLVLYALITADVICFYRDVMTTVTVFVILAVSLFPCLIPRIRIGKRGKADPS